jgi:hypothetical protein
MAAMLLRNIFVCPDFAPSPAPVPADRAPAASSDSAWPSRLSWSNRCRIEVDQRENGRANKKIIWKTTYPPPADGLCVPFLCKSESSANNSAAQAGRGASQVIALCTVCKLWKKNAASLHNRAVDGLKRESAAAPGFAGWKTGKRRFERVFHFAIDVVRQVLGCVSEPW